MTARARLSRSSLVALLALPAAAIAALPEPVINGVVVQDVTQSYAFDRVAVCRVAEVCDEWGTDVRVFEDFYRGTVRSKVIREADGTFDFYFRVTHEVSDDERNTLSGFRFGWSMPFSYEIAHHAFELSRPSPTQLVKPVQGDRFTDSSASFFWLEEQQAGLLREAVFVLDTEARAYAPGGTYGLGAFDMDASARSSGDSGPLATFAPAVPEPETWALMAVGLGVLAWRARRRPRQAPRD